jgi:hypothetical protein
MPEKPPQKMTDSLTSSAAAQQMTAQMAVEIGKKKTMEILGPAPAEGDAAIVIQHGKCAHRPDEPAWIQDHSNFDHHLKLPVPCHVLRYEDGQIAYLPMAIPGYPLDKVPLWVRMTSRWYCEWTYASAVRKSLKLKGR